MDWRALLCRRMWSGVSVSLRFDFHYVLLSLSLMVSCHGILILIYILIGRRCKQALFGSTVLNLPFVKHHGEEPNKVGLAENWANGMKKHHFNQV